MRRITLAMATVALGATVLTGCGNDDDQASGSDPSDTPSSSATTEDTPSEEPTTEEPVETTEPAPAPETEEEGGGGGTGQKTTPDGTELAFGDQAVLAYDYAKVQGTIGLTAVGIKKGTPADLKPLKLGAQGKGLTPYYITYEVTNLSGDDFDFSALTLNYGLFADDSRAQNLSVIGDFPQCDSESAPSDFGQGDTYTTCAPVVSSGDDVVGALYVGDLDEGISWR